MILFENTDKTYKLDDISVDYQMLELEDLNLSPLEVTLYFNSDKSFGGIEDINIDIPMNLKGAENATITLTYSPVSQPKAFNIEDLDDSIYEVDTINTDNGESFIVTVSDLDMLNKVLDVDFTQTITYPFDNTSKNDMVNKYLEDDNVDMVTKIVKYIKTLVYKVDEYKHIHSSTSNMETRARKQEEIRAQQRAREDEIRAGRSDIEMLRDEVKTWPGIRTVQYGELTTNFKYKYKLKIFSEKYGMVEILANTANTKFMCKSANGFGGIEKYKMADVVRWLKNALHMAQAKPVEDDIDEDDEDIGSELAALGLEA